MSPDSTGQGHQLHLLAGAWYSPSVSPISGGDHLARQRGRFESARQSVTTHRRADGGEPRQAAGEMEQVARRARPRRRVGRPPRYLGDQRNRAHQSTVGQPLNCQGRQETSLPVRGEGRGGEGKPAYATRREPFSPELHVSYLAGPVMRLRMPVFSAPQRAAGARANQFRSPPRASGWRGW